MFASNNVKTTNDVEVLGGALDESITALNWHPTQDYLIASSWDNIVRCWEVKEYPMEGLRGEARAASTHQAPVLATCFSGDGNKVFSGDCNKQVMCWDLVLNQSVPLDGGKPVHDAPVSVVRYMAEKGLLMTGSWDKTIKYWDGRTSGPVLVVNLPDKLFCADAKGDLLVTGCANRKCQIYDLRNNQGFITPLLNLDSPLKFQTRCLSAFIDQKGFSIGSIEGRCAIYQIDDPNKNFAFKCHREGNAINAVNAIDHHPRYGTFATCGSDGLINFWDKDSKARLKAFTKNAQPITCGKFNNNGMVFAYALCYDWSSGLEGYKQARQMNQKSHIMLHQVTDPEIRPR
jgi:mRNA export factor